MQALDIAIMMVIILALWGITAYILYPICIGIFKASPSILIRVLYLLLSVAWFFYILVYSPIKYYFNAFNWNWGWVLLFVEIVLFILSYPGWRRTRTQKAE